MFEHKNDIIGIFAQHRVAANLLMVILLLAGIWSVFRLNTQFFPNFALDIVNVRVVWTGASAEDVERSITNPLEQELRNLDNLKKMTSTSANGVSSVTLEYVEGTNMGTALDQVKEKVGIVRQLPSSSEEPEVTLVVRYEPIARVLVTGLNDRRELRPLVRSMERELLDRGIAKVNITGLPEEEIAIQVSVTALHELGLSLDEIAQRVSSHSRDLPAGTVGRDDVARQLRSLEQRRQAPGFADLPLVAQEEGRLVQLGDVAEIQRRPREKQVTVSSQGRPAVELQLMRPESGDSLEGARILADWAEERAPTLPPGVEIQIFDERWQLIKERIFLLLKNGAGGLLLVIGILFLFLNGRVATWVVVGIPVSFMGTLAVLYAIGGTINMISLFALIMALGIIVDDAIVVGEDALTHFQTGENSLEAAEGGARRMLPPVISSSLTTIAAFLPLVMVGGIVGNILGDIPTVVICVIIASLVECFLILPGHLRHAFRGLSRRPVNTMRRRLDELFAALRDRWFRALVTSAIDHRWTTVSLAVGTLIVSVGLVAGGRTAFTFFPTVESNVIYANANFVAGTPPERVRAFLGQVQATLRETERELGGGLVVAAVTRYGTALASDERVAAARGNHLGSMLVELLPSDSRQVRNEAFIARWENKLALPPGLENFTIASRRAGHPGRAVNVELRGASPQNLKGAAIELAEALRVIPGVSAIEDDMPYGQEQLIYSLTARGRAVGLTIEDAGRQLRAAFDGHIAQIFHQNDDEVEVRVVLPDSERHSLATLEDLQMVLPDGQTAPLRAVLRLESRQGFETLRHAGGRLAVAVLADVDRRVANENRIRAVLERDVLPSLSSRYGVSASFEGKASDQTETLTDMKHGLLLALALIYLVLAWVFASYGWPLVIMTAIPFGVIGAVVGHYVMGIDLTILSLFGLFGLSGIVVNDSIILVTFYKRLRDEGLAVREAIIEAACQRLRAVLLTSMTTIAGLTPLLFETSLQAQFLIPMAVSISFGLAFATVLVLIVIPSQLAIYEATVERLRMARGMPGEEQAV